AHCCDRRNCRHRIGDACAGANRGGTGLEGRLQVDFSSVSGLPPVDSIWQREVVETLPGGHFSLQMETGRKLVFDAETNSLDPRGAEYSWKRVSFPLYVGKRWKHDRKLDDFGHEPASWRIKPDGGDAVPAGRYG